MQADLDLSQGDWPAVWASVNTILSRPSGMYRMPVIQGNVSAFDTSLCHVCGSGGRGLSHIHVPIAVRNGSFREMKGFPANWDDVGRDWILFGNAHDGNAGDVKSELERAIRRYREDDGRGYVPTRDHGNLAIWNMAGDRLQALAQRFWNYENTIGFNPAPNPAPKQFSCCAVITEEDVRPSGHPRSPSIRTLKSIKIRFDRIFQQRGRVAPQIQEWHDFLTQGFPHGNPYHGVATDLNAIEYRAGWDYNNERYIPQEGGEGKPYENVIHVPTNPGETNIVIVTLVIGINLNGGAAFGGALATLKGTGNLQQKINAIAILLGITPGNWHVCSFYIR